jgi:hypothetical protein
VHDQGMLRRPQHIALWHRAGVVWRRAISTERRRHMQKIHVLSLWGIAALAIAASPLTMAGEARAQQSGQAKGPRWISGCNEVPTGRVCVELLGIPGSTRVESVGVLRKRSSPICNYGGRVFIKNPAGDTVWTNAKNNKGCTQSEATFFWGVHRSFPSGSKVCARFRESGTLQGGEPCLKLRQK